jgi:uncharacterized membrane protein
MALTKNQTPIEKAKNYKTIVETLEQLFLLHNCLFSGSNAAVEAIAKAINDDGWTPAEVAEATLELAKQDLPRINYPVIRHELKQLKQDQINELREQQKREEAAKYEADAEANRAEISAAIKEYMATKTWR